MLILIEAGMLGKVVSTFRMPSMIFSASSSELSGTLTDRFVEIECSGTIFSFGIGSILLDREESVEESFEDEVIRASSIYVRLRVELPATTCSGEISCIMLDREEYEDVVETLFGDRSIFDRFVKLESDEGKEVITIQS